MSDKPAPLNLASDNPEANSDFDNPILERRALIQARTEVARLIEEIVSGSDADEDLDQQLVRIIRLNGLLIPIQLKEAVANIPNEARSVAASRTLQSIKDLQAIIIKRSQIQSADDFNVYSPRAKAVWGWLIELFYELASKHLNESEIANIFNELASRLVGWEESVDKRLKGVPVKMIPMLDSPFLQDFKEAVATGKPLPPSDEAPA